MTATGLTFLSWVRTGLISAVGAPAGSSGNPLDAVMPASTVLPVTLSLDGGTAAPYDATLAGASHVTALDTRQIIRHDPVPGAMDVEPNYFALIEFDRPDLPWLLTPNAPSEATLADTDARRGLRPWLCLIVVTDRQLDPPTGQQPLPKLKVSDAELPDLETAWLWVHAQVLTNAGDDLSNLLANAPERTLSRLIAPRRLATGTTYLACVVPTFDAGRRKGLGLDAVPAGSLAPAWIRGATPADVELPVYHSWRFTTSKTTGDFEMLARRLKAARFGDIGVRDLDIGHAGAGLAQPAAGASPWIIDLEGAIVGDRIVPGAWPATVPTTIRAGIATRLASSAAELAPPTYGSLQAGYGGALTGNQGPVWLRSLNLDPRYRATASLGTEIVRSYQEALVRSAWEQTADMREANRLLRQAQLARAVGESLHARIGPGSHVGADTLLQLTSPVHEQIADLRLGVPIRQLLAQNPGVEASVSVAFRRSARPIGPLAKRLWSSPLAAPVERLGLAATRATALRPTPTLRAIPGTVDLGAVSASQQAPESIGAITAVRMLKPKLRWEPGAPPQTTPQKVPIAYLADLIVSSASTVFGHALDFDGSPQLDWHPPPNAAFLPSPGSPVVAWTYVERDGVRGVLSAAVYTWYANRNAFSISTTWTPGYLLKPDTLPIPSGLSAGGELPELVQFTTADVKGTGAIDVVMFWADNSTFPIGQPGMSARFTKVFMKIGFDLDPTNGNLRGGTSSVVDFGEWDGRPFGIAGAGSTLYKSDGPTISIFKINNNGSLTHSGSIDVGPLMPEDLVSTSICAADFGGGTGVDLLVGFVAGRGASERAGYRVAFDVKPDGSVGSWGDSQPIPVAVSGGAMRIAVGAIDETTDRNRNTITAAFRAAAAGTQARQERISALSAAPPAAPSVDTTQLAGRVRSAIDPTVTVPATVTSRLTMPTPIDATVVTDPLQPLALTPTFPYPTMELLRDSFQDRIMPGAATLPDDCVTALFINQNVVESFLVGLNHEMSRELLWRGFPVRHGTFFSRFWNATRDEITPIESWRTTDALGAHRPATTAHGSLLLVVRAELIRRIPDVTIYASPAKASATGTGRTVDTTVRKEPVFASKLDPDIRVFAFDLTARQARGVSSTDGWYFVFQEHPTAPRFGLDEATTGFGTTPTDWSNVSWPQMVATSAELAALGYVDAGSTSRLAGRTLPDGGASTLQHRWGFSAAHMAHITLQRPVQIAIHGSDLIDPGIAP